MPRPDEYLSLKLPVLATSVTNPRKRKSPVKRSKPEEPDVCLSSYIEVPESCRTELTVRDIKEQISKK